VEIRSNSERGRIRNKKFWGKRVGGSHFRERKSQREIEREREWRRRKLWSWQRTRGPSPASREPSASSRSNRLVGLIVKLKSVLAIDTPVLLHVLCKGEAASAGRWLTSGAGAGVQGSHLPGHGHRRRPPQSGSEQNLVEASRAGPLILVAQCETKNEAP
jgi:hypothetical protein